MKLCSWWCLPLAQAYDWLPQNHMAAFNITPSQHRNCVMLWICLSLFSGQNCNQKISQEEIKVNFHFLGIIINAMTILEKASRPQQMTWWSKFGEKKEREDSYYPYVKSEETSVGNGDKPLLPDYSNVSEKHFTYGNTCLNLAGFIPRTHPLCKLNTDVQERTKVLLGLKCLPYWLCVLTHLPSAGYSCTAGCWRKNGEVRHSDLHLKLQRAI